MEWPFFDLRLTLGDVVLRGVADADLDPLLALLPDDLDHDPRAGLFAELDAPANRRRIFTSEIWRHRGTWTPASWCLDLCVEVGGELVGHQALEGDDFPTLGTVDSFSWLAKSARGRGTATAMRAAALGFAFEHLGAVAAVSSATMDNAPSLAVSRRLGYADNGVSLTDSTSGVVQLQHLRLTRERWLADGRSFEVSGAAACLPWFGLGSARDQHGDQGE
jgi:RimJ/RimL family protein N-acetyltransferase